MSGDRCDDGVQHFETAPYDPRYERGQSVEDAKARYLHQDGYTLDHFESDLDRLLHTDTDREVTD